MLGTVAWRGHYADPQCPYGNLLARTDPITEFPSEIRSLRAGAGLRNQAQATRHVIGVVMGIENMGDAQALGGGNFQVDINVPARINDDSFAAVAEDVGGAAQISIEHLPEEHLNPFPGGFLTGLVLYSP